MDRILFIDACVREQSRTRRLAQAFLKKLDGEIEHLKLSKDELPVVDEKIIEKRGIDAKMNDFTADEYRFAREFAEADVIVIAAPFWDMSFPSILKDYIEAITVSGLTFYYGQDNMPHGLCKAKKLYYVTTAGGEIFNKDFGYGYISFMAKAMYGIEDTEMIALENLDLVGNDPEAMLEEAISKL